MSFFSKEEVESILALHNEKKEKELDEKQKIKQIKEAMGYALQCYVQIFKELPSLHLGNIELQLNFSGVVYQCKTNIASRYSSESTIVEQVYDFVIITNGVVFKVPRNCNGNLEPWRKSQSSIAELQMMVQTAIDNLESQRFRLGSLILLTNSIKEDYDHNSWFSFDSFRYKPLSKQEIEEEVKNDVLNMIKERASH